MRDKPITTCMIGYIFFNLFVVQSRRKFLALHSSVPKQANMDVM